MQDRARVILVVIVANALLWFLPLPKGILRSAVARLLPIICRQAVTI